MQYPCADVFTKKFQTPCYDLQLDNFDYEGNMQNVKIKKEVNAFI